MQPQTLARRTFGDETIDACLACQAFWFDAFESTQLAPGATLALFDVVRKAAAAPARPLPARLPCPRCTEPLALTHDLQRTTRFLYYRCAAGHGRFTPFLQFLREKDFVRAPSPAELERLKSSIRVIRCSSCGAPIDLERDAACPYCHSPLAILDPGAVADNVRQLAAAEAKRTTIDVDAFVDGMLDLHRHAAAEATPATSAGAAVDLVALGLAAAAALFGR